ncbi:hypothetical protein [Persicobacter psychrovividus]|uniref:Uncharacterized protein n=1 Tax=Persicobacter psychrovividus TaxID=387638 RepID=A0ABN6LG68_9BACT|nr:hypothetical protein PEPS_26070 [Persicobacter psychrovividus]
MLNYRQQKSYKFETEKYRDGLNQVIFYYDQWIEALRSYVANKNESPTRLEELIYDERFPQWLDQQLIPAYPNYPIIHTLLVQQEEIKSNVKLLIESKSNGDSQLQIIRHYQQCANDLQFGIETIELVRKQIANPTMVSQRRSGKI